MVERSELFFFKEEMDKKLLLRSNIESYGLIKRLQTHKQAHAHTHSNVYYSEEGRETEGRLHMILIWSSFTQMRAFLMPRFEVKERHMLVLETFPIKPKFMARHCFEETKKQISMSQQLEKI